MYTSLETSGFAGAWTSHDANEGRVARDQARQGLTLDAHKPSRQTVALPIIHRNRLYRSVLTMSIFTWLNNRYCHARRPAQDCLGVSRLEDGASLCSKGGRPRHAA